MLRFMPNLLLINVITSIPDGPEFLKPEPKSHFLRKDDEKWNKDDTTNTVKFDLRRWRDLPFQGVLGKAITVDWWNPYDLLGLFLSILGPAPAGADKTNYFQPLTAVYGQWCSRVGGEVAPPGKIGVGYPPAVFQVTWKKWRPEGSKLADRIDYFLGSSLAGDGWKEKEVGQWRVRVRKARFDMFHDALSVELFSHDDFDPQADGQSFGTCAETYPFIFNVRGYDLRRFTSCRLKSLTGYQSADRQRNPYWSCADIEIYLQGDKRGL